LYLVGVVVHHGGAVFNLAQSCRLLVVEKERFSQCCLAAVAVSKQHNVTDVLDLVIPHQTFLVDEYLAAILA